MTPAATALAPLVDAPSDRSPAYADFYAAYHARLRRFCVMAFGYQHGDDIAQDAMVRAFVKFDLLDPSRDPWPWLTTIARRTAYDRHAKEKVTVELDESANDLVDRCVQSADEQLVAREDASLLTRAMSMLPAQQRRVLEWHLLEDVSCVAIAELLDMKANAVRQLVHRARRRLAVHYTELGGRARSIFPLALFRWRPRGRSAASTVGSSSAAGSLGVVALAQAALILGVTAGVAVTALHSQGRPERSIESSSQTSAGQALPREVSAPAAAPAVLAVSKSMTRPAPAHAVAVAQGPVRAQAVIAKDPYKAGAKHRAGVWVETPVGEFGQEVDVANGRGGVICQFGLVIDCG